MSPAWDQYKKLSAEQDALTAKLIELARSMGADYVNGKIIGEEHLSAEQLRALAAKLGESVELGMRIQLALGVDIAKADRPGGLN